MCLAESESSDRCLLPASPTPSQSHSQSVCPRSFSSLVGTLVRVVGCVWYVLFVRVHMCLWVVACILFSLLNCFNLQ
jgi:hypothetical protein